MADVIGGQPEAAITYFLPDKKKAGGEYITTTGRIKKIDDYERVIIMMNRERIPIDDVLSVDSTIFKEYSEPINIIG